MFSAARFRTAALLVVAGLSLTACTAPATDSMVRTPSAPEAAEAIRAVLDAQVAAWNRGSVRAFMDGYARTDSLRFASGGNVRTGWQTTLEGYERSYPDAAAMGTLRFDSLDVRVLSPQWAEVFGRWRLERADDAPNGLFTLLFEKRAEGWRIVHDHTSSND